MEHTSFHDMYQEQTVVRKFYSIFNEESKDIIYCNILYKFKIICYLEIEIQKLFKSYKYFGKVRTNL